jgi:hypothetical protein
MTPITAGMPKPMPTPSAILSELLSPVPAALLEPVFPVDWGATLEKNYQRKKGESLASMDHVESSLPFVLVCTTPLLVGVAVCPTLFSIAEAVVVVVVAATAVIIGTAPTAVEQ